MSSAFPSSWRVAGSYFESCNCDPICPCRSIGAKRGGRSTYGVCNFVLSWLIQHGHADELALDGLSVAMAGAYDDDDPGSPWRVMLFVDERATDAQAAAIADIFLGRAGGTAFENYAANIEEVLAVRPARIELCHEPGARTIRVADSVLVQGDAPFAAEERISCGIPGHDHPGQELVVDLQRVAENDLAWEFEGRCGFATEFDYASA